MRKEVTSSKLIPIVPFKSVEIQKPLKKYTKKFHLCHVESITAFTDCFAIHFLLGLLDKSWKLTKQNVTLKFFAQIPKFKFDAFFLTILTLFCFADFILTYKWLINCMFLDLFC